MHGVFHLIKQTEKEAMLDGTKTKATPRKLFSNKIAISLDKSLNGRGHYYICLQEELATACSRDL